jgi:A/G-specific adenine glycosylase
VTPTGRLLEWYLANARRLPWRTEPRDPYAVLVSELMLQQTQVERVRSRFETFIERFPTLRALAAASEPEVLALWSGLGYYRRARLLHQLAREVVAGSGELPSSAEELRQLPGVGPYTAAAVASLAFGVAVPVVDGNVIRVAARVLGWDGDPRTAAARRVVADWVSELLAEGSPAAVNEAIMELGATVCLPSSPRCEVCPLEQDCRAREGGHPDRFPIPRRVRAPVHLRWVAACCVDSGGRWLLRQVKDGPILRGLWLPPIAELGEGELAAKRAQALVSELAPARVEELSELRHSITHRRIRVLPVLLAVDRTPADVEGRWIDPENHRLPTSSLFQKLFSVNDLRRRSGA